MKTIVKYSVLFILLAITIIGMISIPSSDCESWGLVLIASKVIGVGSGYVMYKLLTSWNLENVNNETV